MLNKRKWKTLIITLLLLMICLVFETGVSAAARHKVQYKYTRIDLNRSVTVPLTSFQGKVKITCSNKKLVKIKRTKSSVTILTCNPGLVVVTLRDKTKMLKQCIYIYKNNAEKRALNKLFLNKRISVLGDSLSSHKDLHMGKYRYYNSRKEMPGKIRLDMRDQYWSLIKDLFRMKMGVNYSVAGSMISGYKNCDPMASKKRITRIGKNGKPNVILYFGGTNDFLYGRKNGIPVGSFSPKSRYVRKPLSALKNKKYYPDFISAYVVSLRRLKKLYPKATIIALVPWIAKHSAYWKEMIKACDYYHIPYVKLSEAHLKDKNFVDGIHVNESGYLKITNCILQQLGETRIKQRPSHNSSVLSF